MDTITAWLSALGLSQYAQVFQANDIGPDLLESLTDQDLRDLGVQSLGHRKQLLKAITGTRGSEADTPASVPRIHASSPASASQPSAEGERRQLTVLFCDMVGFTELANRVDPEILQTDSGVRFAILRFSPRSHQHQESQNRKPDPIGPFAWERQEHEAVTEFLSLPAVSRFAHDRRERSPANPQPDRPRDGREAGS